MAENLDCDDSNLLCSEDARTLFADLDWSGGYGFWIFPPWNHGNYETRYQDPFLYDNRSAPSLALDFPLHSEEIVKEMVEREIEHMPRDDYLRRLRTGDLDLGVRREALEWLCKAWAYFGLGPLCLCLSLNYLDRFLSVFEITRGKRWVVQFLAVACLTVAAKMGDKKAPKCVELLQVVGPGIDLKAGEMQRMELLLLGTLKWRVQACTPCSFIDHFLSKISDDQHASSSTSISRSVELILSTMKGIDFLEFKPSEIAAAVAISVSGEMRAVDIDKAISCFIHVEKDRVMKCLELMKDLSLIRGSWNVANGSARFLLQSPNGVLDATCLSSKTDDQTVGSCINSPHGDPDTLMMEEDEPSQMDCRS